MGVIRHAIGFECGADVANAKCQNMAVSVTEIFIVRHLCCVKNCQSV